MIFSALNEYYDRLASTRDPDSGQIAVPVFGYSEEKISYVIVISEDGHVVDTIPLYQQVGKKRTAQSMVVPAASKRTGQYTEKSFESGKDTAFFLWDKTAYSLGIDKAPKTSEELWIKSELPFKSFKRFHKKLLDSVNDPGARAFIQFLDRWKPEHFEQTFNDSDMAGTNVVFQVDRDQHYLHQIPALQKIWTDSQVASDQAESPCLVTGTRSCPARIHPAIKGVYGGQSSGGSIVSFNQDAFESYGWAQGSNASVSELAAFKYTTALNYLLNRNHHQCFQVGDTSTVFWAAASDSTQSQLAEEFFMQVVSPTDEEQTAQIRPMVEQLSQGRPLSECVPDIEPDTHFFVLGLAPNAARISVRFWLNTDFGVIAQRLSDHFTDMALNPLPWKTPPSIYRLLIQLVPHREGSKPKSDDIPGHLTGELMRSILTGSRYPHMLLAQLLIRIRSDGHISPLRIALIKAVLHRDYRKGFIQDDIAMSLEEDNTNLAYQLGRLFAVLERIQNYAIPSANATIADRYFASASTTPYLVFPRLIAGAMNHLSKLRKMGDKEKGFAYNRDKTLQSIIGRLPGSYPRHFSVEDQGRFTIGYYQQREHDSTKNKSDEEKSVTDGKETEVTP